VVQASVSEANGAEHAARARGSSSFLKSVEISGVCVCDCRRPRSPTLAIFDSPPRACSNLPPMGRKVWIAAIILFAAAIFAVAKWVRGLDYEDGELWDLEAERLPRN
jgi:hypothetical protein